MSEKEAKTLLYHLLAHSKHEESADSCPPSKRSKTSSYLSSSDRLSADRKNLTSCLLSLLCHDSFIWVNVSLIVGDLSGSQCRSLFLRMLREATSQKSLNIAISLSSSESPLNALWENFISAFDAFPQLSNVSCLVRPVLEGVMAKRPFKINFEGLENTTAQVVWQVSGFLDETCSMIQDGDEKENSAKKFEELKRKHHMQQVVVETSPKGGVTGLNVRVLNPFMSETSNSNNTSSTHRIKSFKVVSSAVHEKKSVVKKNSSRRNSLNPSSSVIEKTPPPHHESPLTVEHVQRDPHHVNTHFASNNEMISPSSIHNDHHQQINHHTEDPSANAKEEPLDVSCQTDTASTLLNATAASEASLLPHSALLSSSAPKNEAAKDETGTIVGSLSSSTSCGGDSLLEVPPSIAVSSFLSPHFAFHVSSSSPVVSSLPVEPAPPLPLSSVRGDETQGDMVMRQQKRMSLDPLEEFPPPSNTPPPCLLPNLEVQQEEKPNLCTYEQDEEIDTDQNVNLLPSISMTAVSQPSAQKSQTVIQECVPSATSLSVEQYIYSRWGNSQGKYSASHAAKRVRAVPSLSSAVFKEPVALPQKNRLANSVASLLSSPILSLPCLLRACGVSASGRRICSLARTENSLMSEGPESAYALPLTVMNGLSPSNTDSALIAATFVFENNFCSELVPQTPSKSVVLQWMSVPSLSPPHRTEKSWLGTSLEKTERFARECFVSSLRQAVFDLRSKTSFYARKVLPPQETALWFAIRSRLIQSETDLVLKCVSLLRLRNALHVDFACLVERGGLGGLSREELVMDSESRANLISLVIRIREVQRKMRIDAIRLGRVLEGRMRADPILCLSFEKMVAEEDEKTVVVIRCQKLQQVMLESKSGDESDSD